MTIEEASAIIDEATASVGEHFESLLILGTWSESKQSHRVFGTSGNWFACKGLAIDFLDSSNHSELAELIADAVAEKEGWDQDDEDDDKAL